MVDSPNLEFTEFFTDKEQADICAWHKATVKKQNCQACGETKGWKLLEAPITHVMFDRNADKHRHDKVIMFILFSCANCGFTQTFSAERVGYGTKKGPERKDLDRTDGSRK